MMLHKPSLFIKRLVVLFNGRRVYDEFYHEGVNIICGENSSGKSTITELLFYSLGGEIQRWKKEASECHATYVEVELNGASVTLKREISAQTQRPMEIYWGPFEDAVSNAADNWRSYTFRRSETKESFSQCLFRALEMPEVRGDNSSNITMHQILRLIYCDQMTPVDRLFRFEQFDSSLHRKTIGDLLCGIYSNALYEKQLKLEEESKLLEALNHRLKSIHSILGEAQQDISLDSLEEKIAQLEKERASLYENLKEIKKTSTIDVKSNDKDGLKGSMYSNLIKIRAEISTLKEKKQQFEFELEDTREFINTIKDRLISLYRSSVVMSTLEEMNFQFCPSCLSSLDKTEDETTCSLCKRKMSEKKDDSYYLMFRQEMELQIKESESLQKNRETELQRLNLMLPGRISQEKELELRVTSYEATPSEAEIEKEEISRKIGYVDRSIENAHEQARLLLFIKEISDQKSGASAAISQLTDEIMAIKEDLSSKKATAYLGISDLIKSLLKLDLDRENEFRYADIVSFDFGDDNISVDGKRQFSASSMVYLKNSFHLAFIWASTKQPFFNYPRLAIFDNIEDKGMEQERSHNFQRRIVETSKQIDVKHQIIFATSMIAPELKDSPLVVGRYYTHNHKSLTF